MCFSQCFYGPPCASLTVEHFLFPPSTNTFLNTEYISFKKKFFLFSTPKGLLCGISFGETGSQDLSLDSWYKIAKNHLKPTK